MKGIQIDVAESITKEKPGHKDRVINTNRYA